MPALLDTASVPGAWLRLSRSALDDVFATGSVRAWPEGAFDGVLILPLGPLSRIAALLIRLFVWRGKVFAPTAASGVGIVVNQVTPLALHAVEGQVCVGKSWI